MNKTGSMKCEFCGEVIPGEKIRELYRHIVEKHPDAIVNGNHCHLCQRMIPFGLSAGHLLFEHNIKASGESETAAELRLDYQMLQKLREKKIGIVEPKRRFPLA